MHKKQLLATVLTVLFTLCLTIPVLAAPGPETNGSLFTYEVEDDGTIEITRYIGQDIADIVVPSSINGRTVTKIDDDAFVKITTGAVTGPEDMIRSDIKSVYFPDSVREIGDYALWLNEGLESVRLPDGLEEISEGLFCACTSLRQVSIPDSVLQIDDQAFCGCEALQSISIPDAVTYIGDQAFAACYALTDVKLPNGGAISRYTTIDEEAFAECTALKTITIPNGVDTIENGAFNGCTALEDITIPTTVRLIEQNAFNDCPALNTVRYLGTMDQWKEITIVGTEDNCALLRPTTGIAVQPLPTETTTPEPTTAPTTPPSQSVQLPAGISLVPNAQIRLVSIGDETYITGYSAVSSANANAAVRVDDLEDQFIDDEGIDDDVYSATGVERDGDDILATGNIIRFTRGTQVLFEATVAVQGDVLGNGLVTISQLVRMAQVYQGISSLEGAYLIAGDFGGSGTITLSDLVQEANLFKS